MNINFDDLKLHIEGMYGNPKIMYLDLYIKRIRLLVYSNEFLEHIYNQIPYIVSDDKSDKYDATIVLWKECDIDAPPIIHEYDDETKTYYYGVKNPEYNEFIKQGHFLFKSFYKILKTDYSTLIHGAVVGINNIGVLLCARGQRGKSTLSVLSMLNGMEYVSDDYLLLEQDKKNDLYASPIYSIITLSPIMSEKLKDKLVGTKLLGLNGRKDKYVYNIANMHNMFRRHYPIKYLIFPEIINSEKPYIRVATNIEKGRAIVHLLHSTTSQMNDSKDNCTVKKMMNMVVKYPCYYIGLSKDIEANSLLLMEFLKNV